MHVFTNYYEWHSAITDRCGIVLSRAYCDKRYSALSDPEIPSTRRFKETYGEEYLDQVKAWFAQAQKEAAE
ncbi:hypothetical protein ACFSSA_00860 [Luteolibacter algae]|uniref:Uncharacterized protein n=1 Tax=Luteolibacter algae TaxID=454151 RepID=A0ABW5D2E0_9BACT